MRNQTTGAKPITKIPMHPVSKSSSVSQYGYNEDDKILAVQFKEGGLPYYYHGVEQHTVTALLKAPSFGRFLQANIVGKYKFSRPEANNHVIKP